MTGHMRFIQKSITLHKISKPYYQLLAKAYIKQIAHLHKHMYNITYNSVVMLKITEECSST